MTMFPDNPFLWATGQLIDYLLPRTGALRSELNQSTSGEQTVKIIIYPSEPPSPYGYMELDLSFDSGEWSHLSLARDMGEGEWLPQNGPIMICSRRYVAPRNDEIPTGLQAERLLEVLEASSNQKGNIFADQWLDHVNRVAWVGHESVEIEKIEIGFSSHYELIEVHSNNWQKEGKRMLAQLSDLAEAATGNRPALAQLL